MSKEKLVRILSRELEKEKSFLKSKINPPIFKSFLGTYAKLNEAKWKKIIDNAAKEYGKVSEEYDEKEIRKALPEVFAEYAQKKYDEIYQRWDQQTFKTLRSSSSSKVHTKANEEVGKELIEKLKRHDGNEEIHILDIGIGSGDTSITLLDMLKSEIKQGNIDPKIMNRIRIHGLDPNVKILENTSKRIMEKGAKFTKLEGHLEDLKKPDFRSKYDFVISSAALHHVPRLSKDAFGTISKVLKTEGYGVISDTSHSLYFPSHIKTTKDLASIISYLGIVSKLKFSFLIRRLRGKDAPPLPLLEGHVPHEFYEAGINEQGLEVHKKRDVLKTHGLEKLVVFHKPKEHRV